MEDIAIKVENLSKVYKLYEKPIDRLKESINPLRKKYHKDFYALKDLSFEVKKGETIGIIGKNGSGKSTLLKIITGVLTPSSGSVQVNGKISALLELGAGFNPEYTGIENIYLNGTIMGFSKSEIESKLQDILQFADIGDFVYQPVKTYSSGMFARLAFALAISVDPDILIVDEALAVGDMAFQNKCFNKILGLMEKGKTVLFVSHSLSAIRLLCNRTIWINDGEILYFDETDTVTEIYEIECSKSVSYKRVLNTLTMNSTEVIEGKYKNKGSLLERSPYWIANIGIYNSKGQHTDVFYTGEPMILEFEIQNSTHNTIDVSIGVAIVRTDNIEICRINNIRDDIPIKLLSGVNYIQLKIKNLNLLMGEYLLSFYLAKANIVESIHTIENIDKIQVKTPTSKCGWRIFDGIVAIDHLWYLNK